MTPGPARLRVGVQPSLGQLSPRSGHGRTWRSVLPELARLVDLEMAVDGARVPDVWLADGHASVVPGPGPMVAQVHEACWFDPRLQDLFAPGFLATMAANTEPVVRAASDVITPSLSARAEVISSHGVAADRVHAVNHGVNHAVFNPRATGGPALVAGALGRQLPYVLFAGSVHPRKNIPELRRAMEMLASRGAPHALVLVTAPAPDRPDSSALLDAATAELRGGAGRVVGFSDIDEAQLAALMAGAAAFCLPSLSEGFGLTAAEALATGVPVVVSDRGSLPEVVGDGGLCVPPTAEDIAAALERVFADETLRASLRQAGLARAAELTWGRTARGWLAVLEQASARVEA